MDRLALFGLALAAIASACLHVADLVGTAHASRPGDRTYLLAVSRGPALTLVRIGSNSTAEHSANARHLTCARLLAVGETRLGLRCQQHAISEY